jgi:hypothetical protein
MECVANFFFPIQCFAEQMHMLRETEFTTSYVSLLWAVCCLLCPGLREKLMRLRSNSCSVVQACMTLQAHAPWFEGFLKSCIAGNARDSFLPAYVMLVRAPLSVVRSEVKRREFGYLGIFFFSVDGSKLTLFLNFTTVAE